MHAHVEQIPDGVSDEEGVLLGDILSTAFFCAENAGLGAARPPGAPLPDVAVVGCGPVGLLACLAAKYLGVGQVSTHTCELPEFGTAGVPGSKVPKCGAGEHSHVQSTWVWDCWRAWQQSA